MLGIVPDHSLASDWYTKTAGQGVWLAQHTLGDAQRDEAKATLLFRKAAARAGRRSTSTVSRLDRPVEEGLHSLVDLLAQPTGSALGNACLYQNGDEGRRTGPQS